MKTREERQQVVKNAYNEVLLQTFAYYTQNFSPIDEEFLYNYDLVRREIIKRMVEGGGESL